MQAAPLSVSNSIGQQVFGVVKTWVDAAVTE